jgi:hypothetical protein
MKLKKKGYAYFVELALAVMIIFIVLNSYYESTFETSQNTNTNELRWVSWQIMKNLDTFEALNSTDTNVTDAYVYGSLNDFTSYELEYYNSSGCYPIENGTLSVTNYTKCPAITTNTKNNIVSSLYSQTYADKAEAFRLYLWRKI